MFNPVNNTEHIYICSVSKRNSGTSQQTQYQVFSDSLNDVIDIYDSDEDYISDAESDQK